MQPSCSAPNAAPASFVRSGTHVSTFSVHLVYQLVYASTAARPMREDDLLDLLRTAREKNARLEVTGLLLYRNGAFLQVLEGDQETVDALYATIRADPRHTDVIQLLAHDIPHREFPDWAMGFEDLSDAFARSEPGFRPFLDEDLTVKQLRRLASSYSAAYEALITFKRVRGRG